MELEALDSDNSQSNQISAINVASSSENVANVSENQNCVKKTLTLLDGKFFKYDSSSSNGKNILVLCEV